MAELRATKRLDGQATPASGAMQGAKGDIRRPGFLIENKSTLNESFSIKLQVLAKIAQEAQQDRKNPALAIQFITGNGRPQAFGAWVAVPETLFREMERAYMAEKDRDA